MTWVFAREIFRHFQWRHPVHESDNKVWWNTLLDSLNHIHILQVSPQLSCGITWQTWLWYLTGNKWFGDSGKLGKITKLYCDVIMDPVASKITSLTIVYSTVYSDAYQIKHQSSVSLAFVRGIHRSPVNSPHKWPVTRKMFPFDDVILATMFFAKPHNNTGGRPSFHVIET